MDITIRTATKDDLDEVNRVIEMAIMTWKLPQRVKRLSIPGYRYTPIDFAYLAMVVAEDKNASIVGVAAWEEADAKNSHNNGHDLLLHGIYVEPGHMCHGIGRRLFLAAEQAVRTHRCDGLLVKAQTDADGFFKSMGMRQLDVRDAKQDYAHRYWKCLDKNSDA